MITGMVLSGAQFESIENLIRTDRKKQSWIDKSFVNLLRATTTDREWNQRVSHKTYLDAIYIVQIFIDRIKF